jgi:ankyrin repeat protein
VCQWLHQAGCVEEIECQNAHGNNPLHFACRQGQLKVAQWLVSVCETPQADFVVTQNKQNNTPMHFACRGGHLEVCKVNEKNE